MNNFIYGGQRWFSCKSVLEGTGKTWNGKHRNLRKVPDNHKAIFRVTTNDEDQNMWFVTNTGRDILINGSRTPLVRHQPPTREGGSVFCKPNKRGESSLNYKNTLIKAKANPSQLLICLLLDETGLTPELRPLIAKLSPEEQEQVLLYIEWLEAEAC